jgi:hypothetical protein
VPTCGVIRAVGILPVAGPGRKLRIRGGFGQPYSRLQSGVSAIVLCSSARRSGGLSPCMGKGVGVGGAKYVDEFRPAYVSRRGWLGGCVHPDYTAQAHVKY